MSDISGVIGATTNNIIRGNLTPPRGAIPTGELWNGRTVYKRLVRPKVRQVARDGDGNILYHLGPSGEKRRPQWELADGEPYWEEFLIDDMGNGMTYKNYGFRPTQDEVLAEARTAARSTNMDRLAEALEKANLSVEDIVAVVQGLKAEAPDLSPDIVDDPEEIAQREIEDEKKKAAQTRAANARAAKDALKE